MDFAGAKEHIVTRLRDQLDNRLCYHDLEHTLDVYEASMRLCDLESVSGTEKNLIGMAALFHDAGMLIQYNAHEIFSTQMAREILPGFGFTQDEINEICHLILATQMPQSAENIAEMIICDADLDYLGRNDFFIRSFQLRQEWMIVGVMDSSLVEWLTFQVRFLESHQFMTGSALRMRNEGKLKNIESIKKLINNIPTD
jgi:uncharacterized protein